MRLSKNKGGIFMYCKHCGREVRKSTKICPHCGEVLKKSTPAKRRKRPSVFLVVFIALLISIFVLVGYPIYDQEKAARTTAEKCAVIESVDFHGTEISAEQMSILDPSNLSLLILGGQFNDSDLKGADMKLHKKLSLEGNPVYTSKNLLYKTYLFCREDNIPRYITIDFSQSINSDFFEEYVEALENVFGTPIKWYYDGDFYETDDLNFDQAFAMIDDFLEAKGNENLYDCPVYFAVTGNNANIKLNVNKDGTFSATYDFNEGIHFNVYDECIAEAVPADYKSLLSGETDYAYTTFTGQVIDIINDSNAIIKTADGDTYEVNYYRGSSYASFFELGDTVIVYGAFFNLDPTEFGSGGNYPIISADIIEEQ